MASRRTIRAFEPEDRPGFEGAGRAMSDITATLMPGIDRATQEALQRRAAAAQFFMPVPGVLGAAETGIIPAGEVPTVRPGSLAAFIGEQTSRQFRPTTMGEFEAGLPLIQGVQRERARRAGTGGSTPIRFRIVDRALTLTEQEMDKRTDEMRKFAGDAGISLEAFKDAMRPARLTANYMRLSRAAGFTPSPDMVIEDLGADQFSEAAYRQFIRTEPEGGGPRERPAPRGGGPRERPAPGGGGGGGGAGGETQL